MQEKVTTEPETEASESAQTYVQDPRTEEAETQRFIAHTLFPNLKRVQVTQVSYIITFPFHSQSPEDYEEVEASRPR